MASTRLKAHEELYTAFMRYRREEKYEPLLDSMLSIPK